MLDLYRKYYQDRQFERQELFRLISEQHEIRRVLYPGSFVHVTPSFIFPEVVYVDNDRQAKKFFASGEACDFIASRKQYPAPAIVRYLAVDYQKPFDEPLESFDLLISQYAGLVSKFCKSYLKVNGLLLANNSHGDAGWAALDDDYEFIAAYHLRNNKVSCVEKDLDQFFIPKTGQPITQEEIEQLKRGIGYTKAASAYLFRRIR